MDPVKDENISEKKNNSGYDARSEQIISNGVEEKIEYKDFEKLVMQVGEIKSAEKHPHADKLLVLQIDIGEGMPRTIVAGIAPFFQNVSTLVGKRCCVVANLVPRVLRGVESDGMLLAASVPGQNAGDEEHFTLIVPESDVPVGTQLR